MFNDNEKEYVDYKENSIFDIMKKYVEHRYYSNTEQNDGYKLDFCYVESDQFNACSYDDKTNKADVVRINKGTINTIEQLSKFAFAKCDEIKEIVKGEEHCSYVELLNEVFSIYFIYCHEIGHLINGHNKFCNTFYWNNQNYRSEMILKSLINNFSICDDFCLDNRTMEMDADSHAVTELASHAWDLYTSNADFCSHLKNPNDIFTLLGFSISTVFIIMESKTNDTNVYNRSDLYLPCNARRMCACDTFVSVLNHLSIIKAVEIDVNDMKKRFFKGHEIAYKHWNKDEHLEVSDLSLYKQNVEEVLNNWKSKLKHKLEKYARAKLA